MATHQAASFASDWIDAWNSHDLPRILSHYADDFQMHSPAIVKLGINPSGILKGKPAVAAYWRKALELMPDLRFELMAIFHGVDTLTLHYQAANGRTAAEVFHFNDQGLVDWARAHYAL